MSTKANKSTIHEAFVKLDERYIPKSELEALDERLEKVVNEIEDKKAAQDSGFDRLREELLGAVGELVGDAVVQKLDSYEKVTAMFRQFFTQEDLGALIDRKADLEVVRRLRDEKAGVDEVHRVRRALHGLDEKLRHLSVLQAEIAMSLVPAKGGAFQNVTELSSSLKKRERLLGHAKLLCKWIYKRAAPKGMEASGTSGAASKGRAARRRSDELALPKEALELLSDGS